MRTNTNYRTLLQQKDLAEYHDWPLTEAGFVIGEFLEEHMIN